MKNGKKLSQLSLMDEKSYSGRIVTHYGNQLEVEVLNGPSRRYHSKMSSKKQYDDPGYGGLNYLET